MFRPFKFLYLLCLVVWEVKNISQSLRIGIRVALYSQVHLVFFMYIKIGDIFVLLVFIQLVLNSLHVLQTFGAQVLALQLQGLLHLVILARITLLASILSLVDGGSSLTSFDVVSINDLVIHIKTILLLIILCHVYRLHEVYLLLFL